MHQQGSWRTQQDGYRGNPDGGSTYHQISLEKQKQGRFIQGADSHACGNQQPKILQEAENSWAGAKGCNIQALFLTQRNLLLHLKVS